MKTSAITHNLISSCSNLDYIQKDRTSKAKVTLLLKYNTCVYLRLAFLLLIFIISSKSSFAQFTDEMGDICYDIGFRCVTTNIDPIEGLYNVSIESKVFLGNEVLKQQHSDGSLIIYSNSNGTIRDYNNKFEFYRIGDTQTYDVNILWPEYDITKHKRIRIEGTDFFDVSFSLTYEMPQLGLQSKFGEYYVSGLKAIYTIQCKKILPDKKLVEKVTTDLEKRKATETLTWSGTGFSISNKLIVTNFHVIDKAKRIYITNEVVKDTIPAKVVASDENKDIAILCVENKVLSDPKYSITTEPQKTGVNIFVLGYPLTSTMGNEIKATSGIISSQSGYLGDETLYQISAPIQPGNSGAPVFDMNANVVGIVCAHHVNAENVGYAIKTAYLIKLLSKRHISLQQPSSLKAINGKLSEFIEQFKSNVYQIICINN